MTTLLLLLAVASPHEQLGFSSAGAGLAGAAMAEPVGVSAAFYNPAHAASAQEFEAVVGYTLATLDFQINDLDQDLEAARAMSIGLLAPLSLESYGRIGLALAITIPDKRLLKLHLVPSDRPRFLMYENRLQRLNAEASIAYAYDFGSIESGVAVGATIFVDAKGTGTTFYLTRSENYQAADAVVDNDLPLVLAPIGAGFVRWGDWSFGLLVRGPIRLDLGLATMADLRFGSLGGEINTGITATSFYTPLKLEAGLSWRRELFTAHAAIEFHRWSVAPPLAPAARIDFSFEGLPLDFPQAVSAPQRFRDIWIPRLGAEQILPFYDMELALRAGVFYEPTPLRDSSSPVWLDADRIGGAIGVGLTTGAPIGPFAEPISIDLHFLGVRMNDRTFENSGPADFRPEITIAGSLISGGATLTLRF